MVCVHTVLGVFRSNSKLLAKIVKLSPDVGPKEYAKFIFNAKKISAQVLSKSCFSDKTIDNFTAYQCMQKCNKMTIYPMNKASKQ